MHVIFSFLEEVGLNDIKLSNKKGGHPLCCSCTTAICQSFHIFPFQNVYSHVVDFLLLEDYILFLAQEIFQDLMVQVTHHWEFYITAMEEVVEVFHLLVMGGKTRMAKEPETSGVAQSVGILVLLWNVCLYELL